MKDGKLVGFDFPMGAFLAQGAAIQVHRQGFVREREAWKRARNGLADTGVVDEQFRVAFEGLRRLLREPCSPALVEAVEHLQSIVAQGGSAGSLGTHELGPFNLAMAIQEAEWITDEAVMALLGKVVRLTIVAGADLRAQKAYIGNGGCTSLEWLCLWLSGWGRRGESEREGEGGDEEQGLGERVKGTDGFYYGIFADVLEGDMAMGEDDRRRVSNALIDFLVTVRASGVPREWQETILLRLMAYRLSPVLGDNVYMSASFFKRIAVFNVRWLGILFPFEQEPLQGYINTVKADLTPGILRDLVNAFTSSAESRKYFKAFFLQRHWLMEAVVETVPAVIFNLVKRNEQDILKPFLKHFRPALLGLRDADGNTLLHAAVAAPGLMKNMVTLLLQNGFPAGVINHAQVTPRALAVKYKRHALIPLLGTLPA